MDNLENEVRSILRKKNWLVLGTVDEKNNPHSSVVVYQSDGYMIYCTTGKDTLKVRNIRHNNKVSVTLPFRKNFFHKIIPAPPAELHFTAEAEIKPFEDLEARKIFAKYLKYNENVENQEDSIWIKITPSRRISTYGVGVKLLKMRNPQKARNLVELQS
ncbi:MAG: pyridoxamine 5'-phosphate oxidase family protein [Promethearchaeota archaeon]